MCRSCTVIAAAGKPVGASFLLGGLDAVIDPPPPAPIPQPSSSASCGDALRALSSILDLDTKSSVSPAIPAPSTSSTDALLDQWSVSLLNQLAGATNSCVSPAAATTLAASAIPSSTLALAGDGRFWEASTPNNNVGNYFSPAPTPSAFGGNGDEQLANLLLGILVNSTASTALPFAHSGRTGSLDTMTTVVAGASSAACGVNSNGEVLHGDRALSVGPGTTPAALSAGDRAATAVSQLQSMPMTPSKPPPEQPLLITDVAVKAAAAPAGLHPSLETQSGSSDEDCSCCLSDCRRAAMEETQRSVPRPARVDFSEFAAHGLKTILSTKTQMLQTQADSIWSGGVSILLNQNGADASSLCASPIAIEKGMLKAKSFTGSGSVIAASTGALDEEGAAAPAPVSRRRRPDAELVKSIRVTSRRSVLEQLNRECRARGSLKDVDVLFAAFMADKSKAFSTEELRQLLYVVQSSPKQQLFAWIVGQADLPPRRLLPLSAFADTRNPQDARSSASNPSSPAASNLHCGCNVADFPAGQAFLAFLNARHPLLKHYCRAPKTAITKRSCRRSRSDSI